MGTCVHKENESGKWSGSRSLAAEFLAQRFHPNKELADFESDLLTQSAVRLDQRNLNIMLYNPFMEFRKSL